MNKVDCDFYYFKPSGKWKYEGAGVFPTDFVVDHDTIFQANNGMPGIIGDGKYLTVVVIPRENCEAKFAYPRMVKAVKHDD